MHYSIIFVWITAIFSSCSSIELKTKKGTISGSSGTSRGGKEYHYFLGVPYAKPPIDSLRLKNPVIHDGWSGTLDAKKEVPPCLQRNWFDHQAWNKTEGSEDCLYLNIYTPALDDSKMKKEKLPVMVFIHGGAFRCGSPPPIKGPAYFMDEEVIIVTPQYRLGVLGFFSTEDSVIPGNFGLKDQAMALKWIKENIDDYGGDPNCIVAFGSSAGAASVHYLLTSPLSRDLLLGGISQSGVIDSQWAFSPHGRAKLYSRRVLNSIGCDYSSALECMQSLPAEELIDSEREFIKWDIDPAVVFQPVIEEKNEGAFLTVDPRTVKVTAPWITGLTNGEGNMKSAGLINQDDSVLDYFINNIDMILPAMLFVEPQSPGIQNLLIAVKNKYFQNLTERKHVLKEHEKLFFDLLVAYPMKKALERHIGPKYAYFFSYRSQHSLADLRGPLKLNSSKASHADEILSLFDFSDLFPGEKSSEDEQFSKRLVKLWVSFTKSLCSNDRDFEKQWMRYSNNNLFHLNKGEWKMEEIRLDYLVDFWSKAFSLLQPLVLKDEL